MNQNSRSFKILSRVRFNEGYDHPQLHIGEHSQTTELSIAVQNLQQECIQAQEALNSSSIDIGNLNDFFDIETENRPENEVKNVLHEDWDERKSSAGNEANILPDIENEKSSEVENIMEGEENSDTEDLVEGESSASDIENENHSVEVESSMDEEENLDPESKKRKRKKNRLSDSREWEYNCNKKKREQGESYMGRKNNKFTTPRNKKTIKDRCLCKQRESKKMNSIQCYKINEEERNRIFQKFWNLSWGEKKVYILGRVLASNIKRARNRKLEDHSRRTVSYTFFMDKKTERVRVCKTMFCNTFGISMRTVTDWLKKGMHSPENKKTTIDNLGAESRNEDAKTLRNAEKKSSVTEFLSSLPKLESHYCRKSSTKLYLEPRWKSKNELYTLYKDSWCKEKQIIEAASLTLFKYIFDEMNLSLFSPKKDECDICVGYRTKNISEEIYQEHVLKKNKARDEKTKDKESSNKVFTMDLQSVLLCPQSNVSALYYKTKLIVHNFTIFDLHSKNGYCFLWHEGEGELKSSCFASIICNFLATKVIPNIDSENKPSIILYSDGCGAQNRNSTLSNALLNLAIQHNVCIIQKYLEKGHTQMECDSMHSTIERKLSGRIINVPADYVYYSKIARQKPTPYEVQYLHHNDFKDFSEINFVNSIRPGHKVGDPTVQNIRALKYNPEGSIEYKLQHSDEFQQLPIRFNKKALMIPMENLPGLYRGKLKIKREKFENLQSLKSTMEQDYHTFYDTLEHE